MVWNKSSSSGGGSGFALNCIIRREAEEEEVVARNASALLINTGNRNCAGILTPMGLYIGGGEVSSSASHPFLSHV